MDLGMDWEKDWGINGGNDEEKICSEQKIARKK